MNSRSTWLLVVVALVVAGFVLLDFHHGTSTDDALAKHRKIVDFDPVDVTQVELERTNQTIVIQKDGEHWQIVKPLKTRADFSAVRSILDELEFAQRERTLSEKELAGIKLADFGLEQPRVRLTLTGKTGPIAIALGARTPTKEAVYIRVEGRPGVYVVAKTIEDRLDRTLADLRDRTVLEFTNPEARRLESKSADRVVELAKTDGRWRMLQPLNARASQTRINELLTELSALRVQDFVSDDAKDLMTYRLNEPVREVSVWKGESTDAQTLLIGRSPTNDTTKVYAKTKGANTIITIPAATAQKLDVALNDWRDQNLFGFADPDVQGLVLQRGVNQIALTRTNDQWKLTAPITAPAEDAEVSALLTRLTSLTITQFTADVAADLEKYGLAVPGLIVTLTGATTNHFTQVLVGAIDSSNAVQFVKRSDEPFIYGVATNFTEWIPAEPWSLRTRRVAEFQPDQVTRLEVAAGGKKIVLQRGPDRKWQLVEPAQGVLDEDALQAWLGVFTDLNAGKFFDPSAHPSVTAELTITATVADKPYTLTVAAPEPAGTSLANWSEPHLVFTLSAPTVQTLKKSLVKAAK